MKKSLCVLLILVTLVSLVPALAAEGDQALAAAETLYSLGLFKGQGAYEDGTPNFALDQAPNRHEAVTMLVRLIGKEAEALALADTWELPFTDVVEWARPYVGYAYTHGLTNGVSATRFDGNTTVTATQYLTFALRALGYSSNSDFKWDAAWELSDQIGLTAGGYNAANNEAFLRSDTALVSLEALPLEVKGTGETLIDKLVRDSAVSPEAAVEQGFTVTAQTEYVFDLVEGYYIPTALIQSKFPEAVYILQETLSGEYTAEKSHLLGCDLETLGFYSAAMYDLHPYHFKGTLMENLSLLADQEKVAVWEPYSPEDLEYTFLFDERLNCVGQFYSQANISTDLTTAEFVESSHNLLEFFEHLDYEVAQAKSTIDKGLIEYGPDEDASDIIVIKDFGSYTHDELYCGESFINYPNVLAFEDWTPEELFEYEFYNIWYEMNYEPGRMTQGENDDTWLNYWFSFLTELTPKIWSVTEGDIYGFGHPELPQGFIVLQVIYDANGNFLGYYTFE